MLFLTALVLQVVTWMVWMTQGPQGPNWKATVSQKRKLNSKIHNTPSTHHSFMKQIFSYTFFVWKPQSHVCVPPNRDICPLCCSGHFSICNIWQWIITICSLYIWHSFPVFIYMPKFTFWYRSCHFFWRGAGLFPSSEGQTPCVANLRRRSIHSPSLIALCFLCLEAIFQ